MSDVTASFETYESEALAAIAAADTADALEAARIEFLGQKKGRLRDLQKLLGKVPKEDKPKVGQQFNAVKTRVQEAHNKRQDELAKPETSKEDFDVSLPGTRRPIGTIHPLTQTIEEFKLIMTRLGFSVVEGPELEDEHHNFVALNIPNEHPARDPLDNFYLATAQKQSAELNPDNPALLRSQTSTVQIRVMEQTPPPIRIVSVGRVYRPDDLDATHSCMFHQMEGLMLGDDVTMAQLKTVLALFAESYLGSDVKVRFRPSFFPFTEPSVEVDMYWDGQWIEIGGAGVVDPNVLRHVGYDPEEVSGFAFGLGVERFAMRRYEVPDIRRFIENDLRFLRQF
ncbi:phenylalanine--tRNA ligase subunit alpha [Calycomorphotria hydatis]|uniref:Phenylalanine--tRNA ligase alpha subunit n=1 Tax=Calycomorphotria hydatis TaxID=2528027 RepID=A0A517TD03_9PLAN|nr:phenylalanine--tRNA ligase subunit alpha [Calycomorphotria hydatis]QDT66255.1 Phenylalanine--tRNA ligase alpha subunit [Calycomorphotria hydatis]